MVSVGAASRYAQSEIDFGVRECQQNFRIDSRGGWTNYVPVAKITKNLLRTVNGKKQTADAPKSRSVRRRNMSSCRLFRGRIAESHGYDEGVVRVEPESVAQRVAGHPQAFNLVHL